MGGESAVLDQLDGDLGVGGADHVQGVSIAGGRLLGGQRGGELGKRVTTLNLKENILIGRGRKGKER